MGRCGTMISKENVLRLETRQNIYEYIKKNPGLHIREISRNMGIPYTSLRYHIRLLTKINLIEEKTIGGKQIYYDSGKISKEDKQLLALFKRKVPCGIYLTFLYRFSLTRKDLSEELEVDPATISYYLKRMLKLGILEEATTKDGNVFPFCDDANRSVIERKTVGREIFYKRKRNDKKLHARIYKLLITHKNTLANKELIEACDDYIEKIQELNGLSERTTVKKKIIKRDGKKNSYKVIPNESFIDEFLEIFRPPFCA